MATKRSSKSVERKNAGHHSEVSDRKHTRQESVKTTISALKSDKKKDDYEKRVTKDKTKHHRSRTETKKSVTQSTSPATRKSTEVHTKAKKLISNERKLSISNIDQLHVKTTDKKVNSKKNYQNSETGEIHFTKDEFPQASSKNESTKPHNKHEKQHKSHKNVLQSHTVDSKDIYTTELDRHTDDHRVISPKTCTSEHEEEYDYSDDFENYSSDFEDSDDDVDDVQMGHLSQQNNDAVNLAPTIDLESTNEALYIEPLPISSLKENGNLDLSYKSTEIELPSVEISKEISQSPDKPNKSRHRGEILLDLVTLDQVTFDLYSSPPTDYEEYMAIFGGANIKQTYVQTAEDNVPEETQTDPIEYHDIWTQYPPDIGGAVGGTMSKRSNDHSVRDWKHLSMFINEASWVMSSILEENSHSHAINSINKASGQINFSCGSTTLQQPEFRKDCAVSFIACCKLHPHILLVLYDTPKELSTVEMTLSNRGVLCLWNTHQPVKPQKILICASKPLSCDLDNNAEIAFAGMEDGSVAMWDLREPDCVHHVKNFAKLDWVLRAPTYNSAKVAGDEGHHSPVIAVISNQRRHSSSEITISKTTGVIHLATLEEQAVLHIWIVRESSHNELIADFDLGLAPFGRIHLIKSTTINLQTLPSLQQHLQQHPRVLDFKCHPQDFSKIYIATDMGCVISCSAYDEKCKIFCQSSDPDAEITSIDFYESGELQFFLAGSSTGNLSLYSTSKEKPIMVWNSLNENVGVIKVKWSKSSPNIFYVLCTDGKVQLWDLQENVHKPTLLIGSERNRITFLEIGSDKRHETPSISNYYPYLILGYENGINEVHYLSSAFSRFGNEEVEFYLKFVNVG